MSTSKNYQFAPTKHRYQTSNVVSFIRAPLPFKDLVFPLNVYAHAVQLQEGKVEYLHYGLFQDRKTDLPTAQQLSTELLISRLPPPRCRILEVGIGLGKTLSLLDKQGYDVHGITPDEQQIAYVRKQLGNQATVSCQRLEDLSVEPEHFDVMLFQESAQYIDPLHIFNKAVDFLPLKGNLLILDEFAYKRHDAAQENLHLLDDMVAQAKRIGLELVEQLDLTEFAAPTLDYLSGILAIHRQRLVRDLDVNTAQLEQLDESIRAYQKKYASGRFGYALLHFRKKTNPKWRLRFFESEHIPQMLDLFEKTFRHAMTPKTWQWKYGSTSGREIGIWRDQHLIAHYGGIGRDILLKGQPHTAVQIGDVMVDSSERGVLTRSGPFFLMAATFLERFIGYGKPYLVGYGFPNERAMKVAERLGLYTEVGRMSEISWKPLSERPKWGTRLCVVDQNSPAWVVNAVNESWQCMANDLSEAVVGIRDWDYLQHRYLNHPHQQYQVILVKSRFVKQCHGVFVLRHDADGCEIIDVIAALSKIGLLVTHARRIAQMINSHRVFCRITENFAAQFAIAGGVKQSLNIRIPANAWSDGPTPAKLWNRWWLMSGDMDFR